jgi:hypothetical protein
MADVATICGVELPVQLSPTFLQHAACPQCLRWTYVDRLPRYARTTSTRGRAVHEALARLTSLCRSKRILPRRLTDEDLQSAIAAATPHEIWGEIGLIFEWVALWRKRFDLAPKELVGHEERMAIDDRFQDAAWSEASYRGVVDLLHVFGKKAVITDYKGQPNILPQAGLDRHEQGSFYCWLLSKYYPHLEEFYFRIWYLRYGFFAVTRRSRRQLAFFEESLLAKKQKVLEIESWDPIPGEHCGVCDFIHLCPIAADEAPLPTEIVTPEQATRVASALRVKEEWAKEARTKLKVYVEHNEAVQLPGFIYDFRAAPQRTEEARPALAPRTTFKAYKLAADTEHGEEEME